MENNTIRLLECFYSIDGETKRSGELVWFIRVTGCNLHCVWCDTDYCHVEKGELVDIDELVDKLEATKTSRKVTLTGGEPLIHNNIAKLIERLLRDGWDVNIETNGSVDPSKILSNTSINKYRKKNQLWFSLDYKCPGSGMNKQMISARSMSNVLTDADCLKFVVSDLQDLEAAYHRIKLVERYYNENKIKENKRCTYYISPCFGKIELPSIIEFMKDKNLINRVKFQIQIHKVVWDFNERCV